MAVPGSAEESLQLAEHYRHLTDDELVQIAHQKESLTEIAQQTLASEILSRKLTVPPLEPAAPVLPTPPSESDEEGDPYAEDREPVEIRKVWSERDARRLQYLLDGAGIPFWMGDQNATGVDGVAWNFGEGVPVKVMRIGVLLANQVMENYFPKDEQPEPKYDDAGDVAIRCPRCRSTDVVFDELLDQQRDAKTEPKYRWTCASCGNEWQDDGVEKP